MARDPRTDFAKYGTGAFIDELSDLAQFAGNRNDQRYMLGIAGPPLSDARELADNLVRFLNASSPGGEVAIAVHFDWFRKPGHQFRKRGNGGGVQQHHVPYWSPGSFESAEFCEFVSNIRRYRYDTHSTSTYEHTTDEELPNGLIVREQHRIVVIQCPFLRFPDSPWTTLFSPEKVFDRDWYIDLPESVIAQRIYEWYTEMGLNHTDAQGLVQGEDLATIRQIAQHKEASDVILTPTIA
jgi:pantothenate kinase